MTADVASFLFAATPSLYGEGGAIVLRDEDKRSSPACQGGLRQCQEQMELSGLLARALSACLFSNESSLGQEMRGGQVPDLALTIQLNLCDECPDATAP
jgi:hypothetical protein